MGAGDRARWGFQNPGQHGGAGAHVPAVALPGGGHGCRQAPVIGSETLADMEALAHMSQLSRFLAEGTAVGGRR